MIKKPATPSTSDLVNDQIMRQRPRKPRAQPFQVPAGDPVDRALADLARELRIVLVEALLDLLKDLLLFRRKRHALRLSPRQGICRGQLVPAIFARPPASTTRWTGIIGCSGCSPGPRASPRPPGTLCPRAASPADGILVRDATGSTAGPTARVPDPGAGWPVRPSRRRPGHQSVRPRRRGRPAGAPAPPRPRAVADRTPGPTSRRLSCSAGAVRQVRDAHAEEPDPGGEIDALEQRRRHPRDGAPACRPGGYGLGPGDGGEVVVADLDRHRAPGQPGAAQPVPHPVGEADRLALAARVARAGRRRRSPRGSPT